MFAKLPGTAVVAVAMATASRAKTFAIVMFGGAALFLVGGLPSAIKKLPAHADTAYRIGYLGGAIAPVVGAVVLGILFWRRGRRVARAAKLAHAQPTSTWFLRGNELGWVDARGIVDSAHTFEIRARDRAKLAAAAAAAGN